MGLLAPLHAGVAVLPYLEFQPAATSMFGTDDFQSSSAAAPPYKVRLATLLTKRSSAAPPAALWHHSTRVTAPMLPGGLNGSHAPGPRHHQRNVPDLAGAVPIPPDLWFLEAPLRHIPGSFSEKGRCKEFCWWASFCLPFPMYVYVFTLWPPVLYALLR